MDFCFIPVTEEDKSLLETATLGTMNWCGDRFTLSDVQTRPEFKHYTEFSECRGDFGLITYHDEQVAGICWALYLPEEDRGYGYVNEATPEMSLWVAEDFRGKGLGRRLIQKLVQCAQKLGVSQISLSVEPQNFAKQLYISEGFVDVPGGEKDGVMLLSL